MTDRRSVAWAADTWRVPAWLWIGVAAMAIGLLHILLDMGVGWAAFKCRWGAKRGGRMT